MLMLMTRTRRSKENDEVSKEMLSMSVVPTWKGERAGTMTLISRSMLKLRTIGDVTAKKQRAPSLAKPKQYEYLPH